MFEEVKEMIDSTIYTNGRGEVTAQNINLAMHGMVDVVGDKFAEVDDAVKAVEDKVTELEQNGSASSGPAIVYMGLMEEIGEGLTLSLTEEEKAHNAEVFKVIKDAKGQIAVSIEGTRFHKLSLEEEGIDVTDDMFALLPVLLLTYLPVITGFNDVEAIRLATGEFLVSLHPDGTLTIVL